mgnify:CR=1 FL=1
MNIAVVDDQHRDLLAAKTFLTNYLEKNFAEVAPNVQIQTFSNPKDFLSDFAPEKFDLLILDIFMQPLNGIQVAQIVRNQNRDVSIIFLTTGDDFILEGYKVFAVGYFLKPLSENIAQFAKTFQYIFPKLVENQKKLPVRVGSGEILIPYKNIIYIDIDERHKLQIHLPDKQFSANMTYDDCFNALKTDSRFVECYHRILLNMDFIKLMDSEDFILTDGTKIPISKRKSKESKLKYMNHLLNLNSANTW